jgi:hypothetical protein
MYAQGDATGQTQDTVSGDAAGDQTQDVEEIKVI